MRNERSVAIFYSKTTAAYCLHVASTLALHPSAPLWDHVLEWSEREVPSKSRYAIADGVLGVLPTFRKVLLKEEDPDEEDKELLDSHDDRRVGLAEVVKRFWDFMTWEMKSLSVASSMPVSLMSSTGTHRGAFQRAAHHNQHPNRSKNASGAMTTIRLKILPRRGRRYALYLHHL
jgi:hypothetical protein